MWEDPIVEEVRRIREEHAALFGYDLRAIYDDLKESERKSGRAIVSFPPKRLKEKRKETVSREWPLRYYK